MTITKLAMLEAIAASVTATIGLPAVAQADSPQAASGLVEGMAADRHDPERLCPNYTELRVTPPDTTDTVTVPVEIDTCELQVHPMGSWS